MSALSAKHKKLIRRIGRILFWVPATFLIVSLVAFSVLQVPKIQTNFINEFSAYIAQNTSFDITIEHANLTWYDKVLMENITIKHQQTDSVLVNVDEARINIDFYNLIFNKRLTANELNLEHPYIHLLKESDTTGVNVTLFVYELKQLFKKEQKKKKMTIEIGEVFINNGIFTFNDLRKDRITVGKDYYHFGWKDISAHLSQFSFVNDTISFDIKSINGKDPDDQLDIKSLNGRFAFNRQQMSIYDFELQTPRSTIGDSITFYYKQPGSFKYFVDSVSFSSSFEKSEIHLKDLGLFSHYFSQYNTSLVFSGNINGSIPRLKVSDFEILKGQQTRFAGQASFYGLPKVEETFINLDLERSKMNPDEVEIFINEKYIDKVKSIGAMNLNGDFMGFATDFVAKGTFQTDSATINTDINFKIDEQNVAHYRGKLDLDNFDLRSLFPTQSTMRHIDLRGTINGQGLRLDNATFQLTADVDSFSVNGYNYSHIYTNGRFEERFFQGDLTVTDPNLIFGGELTLDLRDNRDRFWIDARIDSANLQPLNLTDQKITISTIAEADMKGLKLDEVKGYFNLHDTKLAYQSNKLHIDSIKFISSKIAEKRIIHLETDGLTGELNGRFDNSLLIKDIQSLYEETLLQLKNNPTEIAEYYANKNVELNKYDVNLIINLWDVNKFIQPFFPSFHLSKNVNIQGNFQQDSTSVLALSTEFDTLKFNQTQLFTNSFTLDFSKYQFDQRILASVGVTSARQNLIKKSETENLNLDAIWSNDEIEFSTNIEQDKYQNRLNLEGLAQFKADTVEVKFLPSDIYVFGKKWDWDEDHSIKFNDYHVSFDNVKLFNGREHMRFDGVYSEDPKDLLNIFIGAYDLQNLNAFLPIEIEGIIDGKIRINKTPRATLIESDLIARACKIEDFLIGNIFCLSEWQESAERLLMDFQLVRNEEKTIDIEGYFYPTRTDEQLDMQAKFDNAHLKIAEPFLRKNFSNVAGLASGQFAITGRLDYPIFIGDGLITDGQTTVNYLNTTYSFGGDINFDENEITAKNLELKDTENNIAYLNGGIFHDGFKNLVMDVTGTFERFKLLNTTSVDNTIYYGTAYGSGSINFLGDISNLQIKADAKSEKGTKIFIPIGGLSDVKIDQKEYINFVDLTDPDFQKKQEEVVKNEKSEKIKGLQLDFDIEMTDDAYVELIFDVKAGDIIRGRGNGNINLKINTDGDFNMFGDYEIKSGGYNFTLYNIINKEFDIQEGGTISWYGDPYGAQLAIDAKYRQLASLAPLMTTVVSQNDYDQEIASADARKKYPTFVDLRLTGDLLQPEIAFDITIEDYPLKINSAVNQGEIIDLERAVAAFKAKVNANEQEMNRQVFSLIILRKFSPENSFQVNSQTIGNSLSEFVSNQLSYWANQVDENLEIDVDLAGLNEEAFNTFQLRLSYTFMDGRLRVTRGGGIPNDQTKDDISAIIGDWTVEYLLTEDGRFRVKMYSRSDLNNIEKTLGETNIETGFSLQFVRSFDELKQILSDSRKKNQEQQTKKSDSEQVGTN